MSLLVALRFVHIVLGAFWIGAMVFMSFFVMPAVRDSGPEGGKVMMALQRRGVMNVMPTVGLFTLVSGVWLLERIWGGMSGMTASRAGMTFGIGGLAALIAFLLGVTVLRTSMKRVGALAAAMGSVATEEERAARGAEIQRLRARGATVGRVVAWLLLFAVAAMAVARYL